MVDNGISLPRFLRVLTLIAFVTVVFLFVAAQRLQGVAFQISLVAIGTVTLVSAITGFLIAGSVSYDTEPDR